MSASARVLNVEPDRFDGATRARIEQIANVDYVRCVGQDEFVEALRRAPYDAVFVRLGIAVDRAALDAAPQLRWVVTPTTGHDHIDTTELERRGIALISLRGETELLETVRSTAEHTWALLLALIRRVPTMHEQVLGYSWRRELPLSELSGKTLGIVGYGRLGRMVASFGVAFGMNVLAVDDDEEQLRRAGPGMRAATPEVCLAQSDVVSLHLLLTDQTANWLDRERFALMKEGAYLVNTARGELVDEGALLDALQSGRMAGAALDVLDGDSSWAAQPPRGHALIDYARTHDNLILSPHIGGYGDVSIERTRRFIAEKFVRAIEREKGRAQ